MLAQMPLQPNSDHPKRLSALAGVCILVSGAFPGAGLNLGETAYPLLTERVAANRESFFIYDDVDSGFNHGFPSGFFGNSETTLSKIHLDAACLDDAAAANGCSTDEALLDRERGTVLRITFDPLVAGEFAGVNFEEPEGWGADPRGVGYDLRGATHLALDARSPDGLQVQFGLGGATSGFLDIPQDWTELSIPLSSLVSSQALEDVHVLFTVVTNDTHASSGGTVLLDRVRLDPPPSRQQGTPTFPQGTETFGVLPRDSEAAGRVPIPPDQVLRNVTTTYESALTAQALLARGESEDLTAVQHLTDAFHHALHHDNQGDPLPVAGDGSTGLHNAYESGDLPFLNDQGSGGAQAGEVRLAGFSAGEDLCGPSGFCLVLDGATGGNNAFAIFALLAAYRETSDPTLLDDARTVARWISDRLIDDSGTGFGGYFLGYPDEGVVPKELLTGKSVENNADIFAAFAALAEIEEELGNVAEAAMWRDRANPAGDFVLEMYDPVAGCFHAGTVPAGTSPGPGIDPFGAQRGDDVINRFPFLDANSFTALGLAWHPRYRNAIDWRRPVQCILDSGYARTVDAAGKTFDGFNLVQEPTEGPDGIAWEFTAQAVVLMEAMDRLYGQRRFEEEVGFYLQAMSQARTLAPFGDGRGLVASTLEGGELLPPLEQCLSTPFQCIPERVGLAATTWALFAEHGVNPFRQALPACLSDPMVDLGAQQVDTVTIFEACEILSAGSGFEVAAPGDVTFRAGNRIVLRDGFSVRQGASFRGLIDPSLR